MMTTIPDTIQTVLLTILVRIVDLISLRIRRVQNIKSSRRQAF